LEVWAAAKAAATAGADMNEADGFAKEAEGIVDVPGTLEFEEMASFNSTVWLKNRNMED
jgi:hypothetical protein